MNMEESEIKNDYNRNWYQKNKAKKKRLHARLLPKEKQNS